MDAKELQVIIATRNRDKFLAVKHLFLLAFPDQYVFLDLNMLQSNREPREIGSVVDRATQKAKFYKSLLQQQCNEESELIAIIGIDDAFRVGQGSRIIVQSEKFTRTLLSGVQVANKSTVYLVRAFSVLGWKIRDFETFMTEIPYLYHHPNTEIDSKSNSYPLENVLTFLEGSNYLINIDNWTKSSYQYTYCRDELSKMGRFLNSLK